MWKPPGRYIARQVTGDYDAFQVVYAFPAVPSYYAFSRDVPDATVQSFQQALDTLKTDKGRRRVSPNTKRILYNYMGVRCTRTSFTDAEVMNLVNTTAAAIGKNASDTFRRINAEEAPYRDATNPALYVFVFDTNVTIVAQADNPRQVGVNFRGKTDVTGKPFRDEIVTGALRNGSGWVDYVFSNPTETGVFAKTYLLPLTQGKRRKDLYRGQRQLQGLRGLNGTFSKGNFGIFAGFFLRVLTGSRRKRGILPSGNAPSFRQCAK